MDNRQTILAFAIGLAFLGLPANADGLTTQGLDDPEVMAPAKPAIDWSGPYAGLSYGRTSTESTETKCFKLGQPKACDDPIFEYYPDLKEVQTTSSGSSTDQFGAFAGYRRDFGRVVGGLEVGSIGDMTSAEAQIGLDLGRALAYGFAGAADAGGESGAIYGAGIDLLLGRGVLLGVKHTTGDLGDMTTIRVGVKF